MVDALLRDRIAQVGTQGEFAADLGINEKTVSRWVQKQTDPLGDAGAGQGGRDVFIEAMGGLSLAELRKLQEISVAEGCRIVLASLCEHPTPPPFPPGCNI